MYQYIKSSHFNYAYWGEMSSGVWLSRSIYQEVEKIEILVDMTNFEIEFLGDETKHSKTLVVPANWDREKLAEKLAHSNSCLIMLDV